MQALQYLLFYSVSYFTYALRLKISAFINKAHYDNTSALPQWLTETNALSRQESASVATHVMDKTSFLLQVEFSSSFPSRFDIPVDGYTNLDRNIILIVSTGLSLRDQKQLTSQLLWCLKQNSTKWEIVMVPFSSRTQHHISPCL